MCAVVPLWPLTIYCLDVTIGNVLFYFSCFVESPPLKVPPCLFPCILEQLTTLLHSQWKACVRPYRPITIWKQWASERHDSCRQLSSYHPGCKRDAAGRERSIIWMPSLKAWRMFCLAWSADTHNTHIAQNYTCMHKIQTHRVNRTLSLLHTHYFRYLQSLLRTPE